MEEPIVLIAGDLALDRIFVTSDVETFSRLNVIKEINLRKFLTQAQRSSSVTAESVLGGPALNIAQYFSRAKIPTDCVSVVGTDSNANNLKKILIELLGREHVHLQVKGTQDNNLTPECIYFFGPNEEAHPSWIGHVSEGSFRIPSNFRDYGDVLIVSSLRKNIALRFVNGFNKPEIYFNAGDEIFNQQNLYSKYSSQSLEAIFSKISVMFGNNFEIDETQRIFGKSLTEILNIYPNIRMIFTTKGANGAEVIYRNEKKILTESLSLEEAMHYGIVIIPNNKIIDRVGAGDAFLSGAVKADLKRKTPLECLVHGTRLAQGSLLHRGGFKYKKS